MKKTWVSIFLFCTVLVFSMSILYAQAEPKTRAVPEGRIVASIKASGSKIVGIGELIKIPSGYTSRIYINLQKKVDGKWKWVASKADDRSVMISMTAVKGTTYRVSVMGRIYDGNGTLIDTLRSTSSEKAY